MIRRVLEGRHLYGKFVKYRESLSVIFMLNTWVQKSKLWSCCWALIRWFGSNWSRKSETCGISSSVLSRKSVKKIHWLENISCTFRWHSPVANGQCLLSTFHPSNCTQDMWKRECLTLRAQCVLRINFKLVVLQWIPSYKSVGQNAIAILCIFPLCEKPWTILSSKTVLLHNTVFPTLCCCVC